MTQNKEKPFHQDVDGYRVPSEFSSHAVRGLLKYKPKPGDFFIVGFPKSGTTWTQQIVALIFDKGISASSFKEFNDRTPFLEICGVEAMDLMKKPGAVKIHTPFHFVPYSPDAKYLYIARNPKDVVVSFYHHYRSFYVQLKEETFDNFFEHFINGENSYGDYFDHVLSWYEHRDDSNVMFLLYEEIKQDTPNLAKRIATFMGDEYVSMLENDQEMFNNILKFSGVEHMKFLNDILESLSATDASKSDLEKMTPGLQHMGKVKSENKRPPGQKVELVRKGKVGGWRSTLTDDQNRRMNEKIEKKLIGTKMYDIWKEQHSI